MTLPGPVPQAAASRPETAAAAALRLAGASLEALALKAGQVLEARVLGTNANGLTQLAIAGQMLTVRLSLPTPPGTQLRVQVQAGGPQSPPVLVAQTQAASVPQTAPPPLPAAPPQLPLPQTVVRQAPAEGRPAAQPVIVPAATPTGAAPTLAATPTSPQPVTPAPNVPAAAAPLPGTMTGLAPQPAKAAVPAPDMARPVPSARAPSGSVAQAILSQATQAAARQDSMAPLLQNLAALQGRMSALPQPAAAAAMRLLAGRISLDRGPPSGAELKQAVLRSGVFLEAMARPGAAQSPPQGDIKSALLQLRALLGAWLGGEVAPVAPVTRRPPPPTRGAPPRGLRSEMPTLPETATPKETGRALLGQTEAALSRVRLLQLASLPRDAARAAMPGTAAAAEWNLELPLLLGHELALAQLQIARDGKGRSERGERGWRMRFSLNFSALGEVGAQVSLLGKSAGIVIWAEEDETAAAPQEMLPELTPALAAKGLAVGSVRVRHGRPGPVRQPSGQLMDSVG
ncbi:MAG: flagellar hook-length control protein FliK [Devosia sp.]|nr:flagellar hook-length control protein FliK [Devosia sp.]